MYWLLSFSSMIIIVEWFRLQEPAARISCMVFLWINIHFILHALIMYYPISLESAQRSRFRALLIRLRSECNGGPSTARTSNLARLLRSQIYCLFASWFGINILIKYYTNWPMDWLHFWNDNHAIYFELAIANWLVCFYEDSWSKEEVVKNMILSSDESLEQMAAAMHGGLSSHHTLTIFAYAWTLYSKYLSGLSVFGLCFELPVLLLNFRDIIAVFDEELGYPWQRIPKWVAILYAGVLHITFHATRTAACFLWPLSIVIWRKELTTVPIVSRIVYHFLGISFIYVNTLVYFMYINRYVLDDMMRVGIVSKEQWMKAVDRGARRKKATDKGGDDASSTAVDDHSGILDADALQSIAAPMGTLIDKKFQEQKLARDLENGSAHGAGADLRSFASSATPTASSKRRTITPQELAQHSALALQTVGESMASSRSLPGKVSSSNEKSTNGSSGSERGDVWLAIGGVVYDVTKFLNRHPGGRDVLLGVAGTDATNSFYMVGHSHRAKKMMEQFVIGNLATQPIPKPNAKTDGAPVSAVFASASSSTAVGKNTDPGMASNIALDSELSEKAMLSSNNGSLPNPNYSSIVTMEMKEDDDRLQHRYVSGTDYAKFSDTSFTLVPLYLGGLLFLAKALHSKQAWSTLFYALSAQGESGIAAAVVSSPLSGLPSASALASTAAVGASIATTTAATGATVGGGGAVGVGSAAVEAVRAAGRALLEGAASVSSQTAPGSVAVGASASVSGTAAVESIVGKIASNAAAAAATTSSGSALSTVFLQNSGVNYAQFSGLNLLMMALEQCCSILLLGLCFAGLYWCMSERASSYRGCSRFTAFLKQLVSAPVQFAGISTFLTLTADCMLLGLTAYGISTMYALRASMLCFLALEIGVRRYGQVFGHLNGMSRFCCGFGALSTGTIVRNACWAVSCGSLLCFSVASCVDIRKLYLHISCGSEWQKSFSGVGMPDATAASVGTDVVTLVIAAACFRSLFIHSICFDRTREKGHHQASLEPFLVGFGWALLSLLCLRAYYPIYYASSASNAVMANQASFLEVPALSETLMSNWFDATTFVAFVMIVEFIGSLHDLVKWSSSWFAGQHLGLMSVLIMLFIPRSRAISSFDGLPAYGPDWFFAATPVLLTLVGIFLLSEESAMSLKAMGSKAPDHLYSVRQLEDMVRGAISIKLMKWVLLPVVQLNSYIAPKDYMFYMFPGVVYDFGDKCDYGLAMQINGSPQLEPKVFQCNVGMLTHNDYFQTTRSTRDMMHELLEDPESGRKGFVSDLVALFPIQPSREDEAARLADRDLHRYDTDSAAAGLPAHFGDLLTKRETFNYREVNLSAWHSNEAAHEFYKNSAAHKKIVKGYYNGELNDFSAMIASLVPHPQRPVRWEVRCRFCKKMFKQFEQPLRRTEDNVSAVVCPYCQSTVECMPYF